MSIGKIERCQGTLRLNATTIATDKDGAHRLDDRLPGKISRTGSLSDPEPMRLIFAKGGDGIKH
jgi:hypothetical protein